MKNEIELREEFQPAGLSPGEEFGSGEVFKVLMVRDNIDRSWRSFEVVSPTLERFKGVLCRERRNSTPRK